MNSHKKPSEKSARKDYAAMCGLDCSSCAAFLAYQRNDSDLREKTAKEWNERYQSNGRKRKIRPSDINCRGCLSQEPPLFQHCLECNIRKCGLEKGIKNCRDCPDYKCSQLIKIQGNFF